MKRPPKAAYNIQMIIVLGIVLVGGLLLNRMIGSVQKQLLSLKKSFLELKSDLYEKHEPTPAVNFEQASSIKNDDDTVSVDSVDIENIMRKLSSESESSVHRCNNFLVEQESNNESKAIDLPEAKCDERLQENKDEAKQIIIEDEEKTYGDMTVKELKAELKSRGIVNPKGNKQVLSELLNGLNEKKD